MMTGGEGNILNVPPEGFDMLLREVISPETKSRDLLPPEIACQTLRVEHRYVPDIKSHHLLCYLG